MLYMLLNRISYTTKLNFKGLRPFWMPKFRLNFNHYWIKISKDIDCSECRASDAIKFIIFQIQSFALLPVTSILSHTSYYVYFYDIQNYSNLFIILQRSTYPGNGCYFIYVNREINNNEMLLFLHHKINILFLI